MHKVENIISELGIQEEILAVYKYGSQVYGTANEFSDHDYIIVAKPSLLNSGSFKNNSVSNKYYTIQGTLYSKAGFINAINNYDLTALECLSLPEENILLKKWPFKLQKWDEKEFVKKVIQKASASRHIADKQAKTGYKDRAKKGMYHALRILMFGKQFKEHQKIINFSESNDLYYRIMDIEDEDFDTRDFYQMFDEFSDELKNKE